jgi:HEAT repeat protein
LSPAGEGGGALPGGGGRPPAQGAAPGAAPTSPAAEEARYRAIQGIDPSDPARLAELLRHLTDPSWRIRSAAVERITAHPRPVEVLPAILDLLTSSAHPGARIASAAALARLGSEAVSMLLPRLALEQPEVRCACADVLGEIGDRRAALAVADLMGDPDANVRLSAAEALGKIGGTWAAHALHRALDAGDAALRVAALDALDRLGVAPPAARLEPLLDDRSARRSALRLLGRSDDPAAMELLARGVAETTRGAREAAYGAVARLAGRRSAEALAPLAEAIARQAAATPSVAAWAEEALGAEDPLAAEGAIRVLGWAGDLSRAPALAAAAEEEALRPAVLAALEALGPGVAQSLADGLGRLSPPARLTVLAALARAGLARAIPELAAAAAGGDPALRVAAIEALGRSRAAAAVPPLVPLLDHPEPDVSGLAAAALVELARGRGLRAEVLAWARPTGEVRIPAALLRLLGQVGDAADLPLVRRGLREPRPATRTASALALGALAARGAVEDPPPEVLDALDEPHPTVRAAAADALGEFGARCASPPAKDCARALASALRDEVPAVRAAAARAVGRAGLERYAEALEGLAGGPDAGVAAAAIEALARMGAATLAVVARSARAADAEVVAQALAAAARLADPAAGALLLEALADPRWDVRRAAARGAAARGDPALADALRDLAGVEVDPIVAEALAEAMRALGG